jgi:hypothetical protein
LPLFAGFCFGGRALIFLELLLPLGDKRNGPEAAQTPYMTDPSLTGTDHFGACPKNVACEPFLSGGTGELAASGQYFAALACSHYCGVVVPHQNLAEGFDRFVAGSSKRRTRVLVEWDQV